MRLPIRWRLTIFYACLLTVIFLLLALLLYHQVDQLLQDNAASYASRTAQDVLTRQSPTSPTDSRKGGSKPPPPAPSLDKEANDLARALTGPGSSVVVYDAALQPLTSTVASELASQLAPAQAQLQANIQLPGGMFSQYVTATMGGRVLVQLFAIPSSTGPGILQLNTSLQQADTLLGQLKLLLGAGLLLALLLALLLGAPLTRANLRPLDRVTLAADRLAAGDLTSRVPPPVSDDEIGRLAATFNQMAVALADSFARQRRFVADASHELKTPLTALDGEVEILLLGSADSDPAARQRLLSSMEQEIGRMTRLVNDLLTLSRMDDPASYPLRLSRLNLNNLVKEVAEQLAILAPDHQVGYQLCAAAVYVEADVDRIRQVLLNLGDNARKFTPLGGHIQLILTSTPDTAQVQVKDDGAGIAPQAQAHIFERFYRADAARVRGREIGGAGLGLAIAHAIAVAHHGNLTVAFTPGQGATFTLSLPLAITKT